MRQKPKTDGLEQAIKVGFPDAFKGKLLSHEECVELRPRLIAVSAGDFESCLAQVLLDLVQTHTGRAGESEYAEEVVRFLDVESDSERLDVLENHLPSYDRMSERQEDAFLKNAKLQSLANISPAQAKLLAEWLDAAKQWPDLAWYKEEIESARAYWSQRNAA